LGVAKAGVFTISENSAAFAAADSVLLVSAIVMQPCDLARNKASFTRAGLPDALMPITSVLGALLSSISIKRLTSMHLSQEKSDAN
jgi:hypothetical protein